MDALKLEEEKLEEQLETYKTQLTAVSANIPSTHEDTSDNNSTQINELQTLQTDLEELISLTQESLLEVKKQLLLSSLNTPLENEESALSESVSPSEQVDDITGITEEGIKCRAPFAEEVSWRGVSYHNALVLGEEPHDKVRVLFTHPRFDSMKPCTFFLEGNCRYTEESCRYSHGHVVSVDTLQPFTDPQYSSLHCGSRCLVKRSDGLWYDAIVRHYGDIVSVQFTTASFGDGEVEVSLDDIFPLSGGSDDSCESSLSSSEDDDNEGVRVIDWKPSSSCALGEWEQYTTGIGSKLLSKMGYVFGKGLGKDNQGRVEPVPIEVLPAGKSLDACAAIKEEKKLKGENQKRKKRRKKNIVKKLPNNETVPPPESSNMFDFINTQLSKVSRSSKSMKDSETSHHSSSSSGSSSGSAKTKNLNVELFQIQEKISSIEKTIKTLMSRITERKDRRVQEHIQKRLKSANDDLMSLRKQERIIMSKMKRKKNETKLSVF